MTTYVYETIPRQPGEAPVRFEVLQSMQDAALTRHPDTGQPVRRVISGGFGLMGVGSAPDPGPRVARGGGGGCGCGGACSCGRG